jgi:hypothetical protein
MNQNKIVIANAYRYKGKQAFFAMHQIQSKIKEYKPDVEIEFHIMWDNNFENAESDRQYWETLLERSDFNITSYDKQFFADYVVSAYDIESNEIEKRLKRFFPLYHVLIGHYLRRVLLFDYYLIYDDDILINYDFKDVIDAILEKKPVLITEPYHPSCDKSMGDVITNMFGQPFVEKYLTRNPNRYGFNAGFQGIDLRIYDEFISNSGFRTMLNMFDYSQTFDENGNQLIHGYDRTKIETQQQSFFGLLNVVMAKNDPYILDPKTTYIAPTFGNCELHGEIRSDDGYNGWGMCLKSKISHFIGHTEGRGKPKEFLDRVNLYLTNEGFIEQ